jgi:hypothetical protein
MLAAEQKEGRHRAKIAQRRPRGDCHARRGRGANIYLKSEEQAIESYEIAARAWAASLSRRASFGSSRFASSA